MYLNRRVFVMIYFFCVKRQAKIDFLKDVESTVDCTDAQPDLFFVGHTCQTVRFLMCSNVFSLTTNVVKYENKHILSVSHES